MRADLTAIGSRRPGEPVAGIVEVAILKYERRNEANQVNIHLIRELAVEQSIRHSS